MSTGKSPYSHTFEGLIYNLVKSIFGVPNYKLYLYPVINGIAHVRVGGPFFLNGTEDSLYSKGSGISVSF